jgi:hypothetical protein
LALLGWLFHAPAAYGKASRNDRRWDWQRQVVAHVENAVTVFSTLLNRELDRRLLVRTILEAQPALASSARLLHQPGPHESFDLCYSFHAWQSHHLHPGMFSLGKVRGISHRLVLFVEGAPYLLPAIEVRRQVELRWPRSARWVGVGIHLQQMV